MTAAAHVANTSNQRVEVIALAVIVCLLIFELVRRKRLLERYAIVWLVAGVSVLVLALWKGLLTALSDAVGVAYPPSLLFVVTFLFVLVMLVNFSTTVSRLSDQNNVLARRVALLQRRLEEQEISSHAGQGEPSPEGAVAAEPGSAQVSTRPGSLDPSGRSGPLRPGR